MQRPEVLECYLMTGDADYLLRVIVPEVSAYEHFLRDFLTRIESAARIKSSFALKQVKYLTALPLSCNSATSAAARSPESRKKVQKSNSRSSSKPPVSTRRR